MGVVGGSRRNRGVGRAGVREYRMGPGGVKGERCDYQGKPEELKWGLCSSSGMGKFGRARLGEYREYRSGRGKRETCNYQGKPEELKWGLISIGWLEADGMGWHGSRKNSNGKTEELKWELDQRVGATWQSVPHAALQRALVAMDLLEGQRSSADDYQLGGHAWCRVTGHRIAQ
jgi:hypothetical protein